MNVLPILLSAQEILNAAAKSRRLIVSSPPGSGKSTKVPQLLLDSGKFPGRIAVLEPRRLAARMLADRVAKERGGSAGGEVGYRVRFEDKTGPKTRVVFETEGILLRELVSDPLLKKYSVIILDEFHERHLHGDLTLAVCLALQRGPRPDLLVVVMSATLDEKKLAGYLAPCETVLAEGRAYPVTIAYCGPETAKLPPWEAAARTCARLLPGMKEGHALVFMPGAYEINRTAAALAALPALAGFDLRPLHGDMPARDQDAALAPSAGRKIIIATNIAETSLTIEGVTAVVDSGLARVARYDGARGINTLFTENIAAPSAAQRAGRAGRTAPGVCARLWTERENAGRPVSLEPEILRLDISEALLTLKACGVRDFDALRWLDPPAKPDADRAQQLLKDLCAVDDKGELTPEGRAMAKYPLHPRYARMMVEGARLGCAYECALIAAAAQGRGLWLDEGRQAESRHLELRSDLAAVIKTLQFCADSDFDPYTCQRAGIKQAAARDAWRLAGRLAGGAGPGGGKNLALASKCFLRAFPDRVAALFSAEKNRYQLPGGRRARLSPKSAAAGAALVCAGEALESLQKGGADITLSFAAEVSESWLKEAFPGEIETVSRPALDETMLTPVTENLTFYRGITIRREITAAKPTKPSSDLIAEEFISGRQKLQRWDEEVEDWLARVEFLAKACPDLGLEPLGEEDLKLVIADICSGARSVAEAKGRPVMPALQEWFGWEKTRLIDRHAPARLEMPGGRRAKIKYPRGREPYLEAKIQDLFSVTETPRVAAGRVPLVVHILAPSMRPVQVTKDLKSFWAESYPKLKPALARRYPRHKWL
ncbi:MAG: ATP-dependent helicase HrpB [Elusimicrobia bacterium GWA2_61_42]|nr:MAG: ATP-dependent helicase HrpB [Elusimicrobia bacterium GWA2_61_42]OGR78874.1 MAG: ATP-dependent helicase HrpB [Elusimicrobia bacterium GWC2_61_25]